MKKGFLLHLLSKLTFAFSAMVLHVYLGRMLTMERYGVIGLILNLTNINYLFVSNGVRQTASMFISRQYFSWTDLVRKCTALQLAIGLILFLFNFMFAGNIASLIGDRTLEAYIRQTAFVIPFTAVYFLCLGVLNGERRYGAESGMSALYPVLRLISLPLIIFLPSIDSVSIVIGALLFAAFISASFGGILIFSGTRVQKVSPHVALGEIAEKTFALIFFYAGVTLLMNVDIMILKRLSSNDQAVGLYTAASGFSKIIYFACVALISVVVPNISKSFHSCDKAEAEGIFRKGVDFFIIILAPLLVILTASRKYLFSILYSPAYVDAGNIFAVLAMAIYFLSMAVYFNTVIHSVKNANNNVIMLYLLVLNVGLNLLLVPVMGPIGVAVALLIASAGGLLIYLSAIQKIFVYKPDSKQISKRIVLVGATLIISLLLYHFKSPTDIYSLGASYLGLLGCYAVLMWILGFVTSKDLKSFSMLQRGNL